MNKMLTFVKNNGESFEVSDEFELRVKENLKGKPAEHKLFCKDGEKKHIIAYSNSKEELWSMAQQIFEQYKNGDETIII